MNKTEIQAQIRALNRSIYGPAQDEMTPAELHQCCNGGLMGPIVHETTRAIVEAEVIKLKALLSVFT